MAGHPGSVLDELLAATGGGAGAAGDADAVGTLVPRWVAAPADTGQAAAVLTAAARRGLSVVVRGAATKLGWGAPPHRLDLVVDTTRMDSVLEHAAGDLVMRAQAGVPLTAARAFLAPTGQRLGLDPVGPPDAGDRGTLGGLVATAGTGPLRLSHGGVRDLLIGATIVRADGTVAHTGGKVVKNVAGYDLGKLLAGSWGTLALVTEVVLRLHPLPAAAACVTVPVESADRAGELVRRVLGSQLVPAAVELDRPAAGPATLAVLLEGVPAGVERRADALSGLLGRGARTDPAGPGWWGTAPWAAGDVALRLTHEPAGLPRLLDTVDEAAGRYGLRAAVRGSAGSGVLHAGLPGEAPAADVAALVATLRGAAPAWSGDVVVLDAPAAVRATLDVWGPVRGLSLMRRVKDQFDPEHRLAPGRFVGGI